MKPTDTPIYDELQRELAERRRQERLDATRAAWRSMGVAVSRLAEQFVAMGEGLQEGMSSAAAKVDKA